VDRGIGDQAAAAAVQAEAAGAEGREREQAAGDGQVLGEVQLLHRLLAASGTAQ
jgi:hypothetical protein